MTSEELILQMQSAKWKLNSALILQDEFWLRKNANSILAIFTLADRRLQCALFILSFPRLKHLDAFKLQLHKTKLLASEILPWYIWACSTPNHNPFPSSLALFALSTITLSFFYSTTLLVYILNISSNMKLISDPQSILEAHRRSIGHLREQNTLLRQHVQHQKGKIKRRVDLTNDLKRAVKERRRAENTVELYKEQLEEAKKERQCVRDENFSLKDRINEQPSIAANKRAEAASNWMYWKRGVGLVALEENESCDLVYSNSDLSTDQPAQPLPSYVMGTAASRARSAKTGKGAKVQRQHGQASDCARREGTETLVDDSECPGSEESITSHTNIKYVEPKPHERFLPDHAWHEFLQARLGFQPCITAWTDDRWLQGPTGTVKLRSQFSKALLTDALNLAAEIWHAWGQAHQPAFMARHAPEG